MSALPNADLVIIEEQKLRHYLLSPGHPAGGAKAAFFRRFGFSDSAWETLRVALLEPARSAQVVAVSANRFGKKYVLEGALAAPDGRKPLSRVIWFLARGETTSRLVTAYAATGAER